MTNKKGEGNVLFRVELRQPIFLKLRNIIFIFQEFFDWALNKNIDYQGDMGVNL